MTKIGKNMAGATDAPTNLDSLIQRSVVRSGMSYGSFVRCITQNAFRSIVAWSESDLERLLLACEELGLSPTGSDIFALQQGQGSESGTSASGVLLVLGVDGWTRIVNAHPQFDGMCFQESPDLEGGVPSWISCTIHRRDRTVPLTAKEYLCEVKRESGAWLTHPRRMLRHRALVQCARLAFGLPTSLGIYDAEEPPQDRPSQRKVVQEKGPSMSCTDKLVDTLLARTTSA